MDPSTREKIKYTVAAMEYDCDRLKELLKAATVEELIDRSGPCCNDPQAALRILCRRQDALPLVKLFIERGGPTLTLVNAPPRAPRHLRPRVSVDASTRLDTSWNKGRLPTSWTMRERPHSPLPAQ
jgi:hypothetical protein